MSLWRHKFPNALLSKFFPYLLVLPSVLCSLSPTQYSASWDGHGLVPGLRILKLGDSKCLRTYGGPSVPQVGPPMFSLTPGGRSRRLIPLSSYVFAVPLCTSLCRLCCSMGFWRSRILYLGSSSYLIDVSLAVSPLVALDHVAHPLRHSVARIGSPPVLDFSLTADLV